MSRADSRRAWLVATAGLLLVALALRVWGHRHGLPFIYNADENAHFVARAIGMFGHSYNPHYFINPPGFTYLLHGLFWLRWGAEGVQATLAADPGAVFGLARLAAAALGTVAVLAGLVAVQTLADGRSLALDARLPALGVAAVAPALRAPFIVVVVLAAAAAAGLRAAGWG